MKRFIERINQQANIISIFALISTIIGIVVTWNFGITLLSMIGITIMPIFGVILFIISYYNNKKKHDTEFGEDFVLYQQYDDIRSFEKRATYSFPKPPPRLVTNKKLFAEKAYYSKKKSPLISILIVLILLVAILGVLVFFVGFDALVNFFAEHWVFIVISLVSWIVVSLIFSVSIRSKRQMRSYIPRESNTVFHVQLKDDDESKTVTLEVLEEKFAKYDKKIRASIERGSTSKDIIAHMLKDTEETTEHFKISKNEAKKSFYISIVFSALGFSFVVFAVAWGVVSQNITPSIISSIGGVFTNVIAGTAFFLRKQSLNQLNHYFDKLSRNQDILLSVKMVERMSKNKRDDMYQEIIKSVLGNMSAK